MKAILLSVQPQHLAKILNGEKTVEIRKTMPKCDLPVEVYLYCTKGDLKLYLSGGDEWITAKQDDIELFSKHSGKVVAKFTLREVDNLIPNFIYDKQNLPTTTFCWNDKNKNIFYSACVSDIEGMQYALKKGLIHQLYAWHITDLVVFDEPIELRECYRPCPNERKCVGWSNCKYYKAMPPIVKGCPAKLTRPPQSWQYVEVNE